MGAPTVAYLWMTLPFGLTQAQLDDYNTAVASDALMAYRFVINPKKAKVTALPTTTIKAEAGPWSADVEVKHG